MAISAHTLKFQVRDATTFQAMELVPHKFWREPDSENGESPTIQALQYGYYKYLKSFSMLSSVNGFNRLDVLDHIEQSTTTEGIRDNLSDMWESFLGVSAWSPYSKEVPLPLQAEIAADLFVGFSISKVLESEVKFQNEADLIVQLGAEVNKHLSQLHFAENLDGDNLSKQMYAYFNESPEKFTLLTEQINKSLVRMGINPMIGNIRMYYDEKRSNLSWCFFDSGVIGNFTTKYSPKGNHELSAVCGIDGSGKTTLVNKLGRVVLPIAHPDDPRMIKFFTEFGEGIIDYERELALFMSMRSDALKKDLTLTAFRFVRNLLVYLDNHYSPLTIFQNIVLDRSSLTNLAYVNNSRKFGEAVAEFVMDHFLNPRKIAVIDTPVSIAYYRATQGRGSSDEFDDAEFSAYVTRATMYRILANVLPNVVLFKTYDGEKEEIRSPEDLAKDLKNELYGESVVA